MLVVLMAVMVCSFGLSGLLPEFFLLDRLVERSVSRRNAREHAGHGPECVARTWRRLRS